MSKQKNIRLNPDVLLEKLPLEPETNALIVKLSDFDIPQEISAVEDDNGILHIRFIYPDKEESLVRESDELVNWRVGRYSGKLIGVDVKVQENKIGLISFLVEKIKKRIPSLGLINQRQNYRIVQEALEENEKELVENIS
jgi:hypothetical protein